MKPKFANAIAANIRVIIEHTTRIVLLESKKRLTAEEREAMQFSGKEVLRAQANIAAWIQQPGTWIQ